jgi:hypothetical protein
VGDYQPFSEQLEAESRSNRSTSPEQLEPRIVGVPGILGMR